MPTVGRARNTSDYVKLLPVMKLDEYAVKLPFYPWLDAIRPFHGWSSSEPTKSLAWYDAYNAVNHDREPEFETGTLLRAIEGSLRVCRDDVRSVRHPWLP